MPTSYEHAVVFITGGGGALGRGLGREWITRRAKAVVLADISQESLDGAVEQLSEQARQSNGPTIVKGIRADTTVWSDIDAALDQTVSEFGSVEYVFANAGAVANVPIDLSKPSPPGEEWWSLFDSHFKSAVNTLHAAAPRLANSPAADKLLIITSSASSQARFSLNPPYGIAKAATNHVVFTMYERMPAGVRLTAFGPNWVNTPAIAPLAPWLHGIKTVEETIAAFMTHVDDPSINGIVTLHEPGGSLYNVEPHWPDRSDASVQMLHTITKIREQQAQQQ